MLTCSREDFQEALKVPEIMGRGPAFAMFIGERRFWQLQRWSQTADEADQDAIAAIMKLKADAGELDTGGLRIVILALYRDTLFAVTKEEYPAVFQRLSVAAASAAEQAAGGA